jgi:hypothetical protein
MFNLDRALTQWRQQMAAEGIRHPEVLGELESHLREEVDRLTRQGETEQRAFETAVERIGRPEVLRAEFVKLKATDRWTRFLRICCYVLPSGMLLINAWTLFEFELSGLQRALGLCSVLAICLYMAWLPDLVSSLTSVSCRRLAKATKLASVLLWLLPIWSLLEAEHIVRVDIGIVPTMVLWCLFGAIAMTDFAYRLNECGRHSGDSGMAPPSFDPMGHPSPPTSPGPPRAAASIAIPHSADPLMQRLFEAAKEEADRLGQDFIGTEHVLLALLRLAEGSFANILRRMHLDSEAVRKEVEQAVFSTAVHSATAMLPVTPRARKAVKLAAREANASKRPRIKAEHVFLGLLLGGSGVAALVLKKMGIHIDGTRQAILREATTRTTT